MDTKSTEWRELHLVCGEDFCEVCGDCLSCYAYDPCNNGAAHIWPETLFAEQSVQLPTSNGLDGVS